MSDLQKGLSDLSIYLLYETIVISVLIVITACIVWAALAWRIKQGPLATPLATTQQVHDAQVVLTAAMDTLRSEFSRLSQDIALVKGSNDSVLNLVSHLVPGLPPQITSLEPASGAKSTAVVIWGNNFLAGCRVWFGTTEAKPTQATDSTIRVDVPSGVTGEVNVYVQGQNGISTPRRFTITS